MLSDLFLERVQHIRTHRRISHNAAVEAYGVAREALNFPTANPLVCGYGVAVLFPRLFTLLHNHGT